MIPSFGIGFSKDENPFRAAQAASIQARNQIDDHDNPVLFVMVFSSIDYSRLEALEIIQETFPQAKIIGCSTSGIILSKTIETRGLAILAINSKNLFFGSGALKNITQENVYESSQEFADSVLQDFGNQRRKLSILLCDGLIKEIPMLLKTLRERLGQLSPILGAGSNDNFQYLKTYQYLQNQILTRSAVMMMLGGQINVGISSQHGWKPLGKPRIVERVNGNKIISINGKKAVSIYEEFFGQQASDLLHGRVNRIQTLYPLGIAQSEEKKYLLQNIIEISDDGSLICQGDVLEGSEVHVMIGNKDSCKQAARMAALEVKEALFQKTPDLIIIFESAARQKILGRQAFQEIQIIKEILGENVPLLGMYSCGELAPLSMGKNIGQSFLQNGAITLLALEQHKV
jgi:hypothetical protein